MLQQLIQLLIWIIVFAIAAYGLYWICVKFNLPQPVMWICGGILLIVILIFIAAQVGGTTGLTVFPHR